MTKIAELNEISLQIAAELIKNNGTVVFPTETVYGLGANGLNSDACKKIFAAKGRPADNPLILHIAHIEQLAELTMEITETAEKLINAFFPAPLTLIFKKSQLVPDIISAGLDSVAVRMPAHKGARRLIELAGVPIAAPSANLSGSPSPTRAEHVTADLDGRVDMILTGDTGVFGIESTVVSLLGDYPVILRPGTITLEMLREVVKGTELDPSLLKQSQTLKPLAPGMKYKHYAPKAEVYVISEHYTQAEIDTIVSDFKSKKILVINENAESLAQNLYAHFRRADKDGYDIVLVKAVKAEDIGLAVMNRLLKAANYKLL